MLEVTCSLARTPFPLESCFSPNVVGRDGGDFAELDFAGPFTVNSTPLIVSLPSGSICKGASAGVPYICYLEFNGDVSGDSSVVISAGSQITDDATGVGLCGETRPYDF